MQQSDNGFNASIALDSKKLAEASKRDSSSMKTIAALTMVFLPGTAIAVRTAPIPAPEARTHADITCYPDNFQHEPIFPNRFRVKTSCFPQLLVVLGHNDTSHHRGSSFVADVAPERSAVETEEGAPGRSGGWTAPDWGARRDLQPETRSN